MTFLRRLIAAIIAAVALTVSLLPIAASASAPGLQINPLQYEDKLSGKVKNGHIDVSNPTDSSVNIETTIRGFRQQGTGGDLVFYDDPDLAKGIKVDLKSFQLGPRDAIRVLFSVDPAKLPSGGVYAAIFFRTIPADSSNSGTSYVSESANVGTLLLLQNGGQVAPSGSISLAVPFWQFGAGLRGSASITNTSPTTGGTAFRPQLSARVLPWGHVTKFNSGLVLPGSKRQFDVSRRGSFFGFLPVIASDAQTHAHRTAWIFATTGVYSWVVMVIAILIPVLILMFLARLIRLPKLNWRSRQPRRHAAPAVPSMILPEPEAEPAPESETVPEPLPTVESGLTQPVTDAEAAAPDPGTLIMPEPESKPVHKIKLTHHEPEPKPKAHVKPTPSRKVTKVKLSVDKPAEPVTKAAPKKAAPKKKRTRKARPEPEIRRATDIRPKRKK